MITGPLFVGGKPPEFPDALVLNRNDILGAGSVATVCRGKFKDLYVAVKILRPGVRKKKF
jgi:hypothetical protein